MDQNRLARRRRAALMRRARRPPSDPVSRSDALSDRHPFDGRTFTVGKQSITSIVLDTDDASDSASSASGDDCPICRAVATLEEYEAASAQGRVTP